MASVNTVFVQGSVEEQALDFARFVAKLKGQAEDAALFVTETQALLGESKHEEVYKKFTVEAVTLLEAPEKEFEAVFNLLIAILQNASTDTYSSLIRSTSQALVQDENDKAIQKMKALSNLYNTLPIGSTLRSEIFLSIFHIAANNDELDVILPQLTYLSSWVKDWGVTKEQERNIYFVVSNKLKEAGERKKSHDFLLKYIATFSDAEVQLPVAKEAAIRAVAQAIQLPEILSFEDLLQLEVILSLKEERVFELLKVFLNGNLKEYKEFVAKYPGVIEKLGLTAEENTRKIRLLTLATLAAENVLREVTYATIAQALEIEEDDVEMWIIDVIRAGLIEAKINQVRKSLLVSRSTYRTFTLQQWQHLAVKLAGWKQSLEDILQVVANAKLIAQHANFNPTSTSVVQTTVNVAVPQKEEAGGGK